MADATIKAWRCDLCGDIYRENDYGYSCYYDLTVDCTSGGDIHGLETHYPQICFKCTQKIITLVVDLDNKL